MSELEHYGVPGMKWGVRKQQNLINKASSKKRMSTKKKVAVGMSIAAAGGLTVAALFASPAASAAIKAGSGLISSVSAERVAFIAGKTATRVGSRYVLNKYFSGANKPVSSIKDKHIKRD